MFFFCFDNQAYHCISNCDTSHGYGKKHMWFIKWKFLEAKVSNAIDTKLYLAISINKYCV